MNRANPIACLLIAGAALSSTPIAHAQDGNTAASTDGTPNVATNAPAPEARSPAPATNVSTALANTVVAQANTAAGQATTPAAEANAQEPPLEEVTISASHIERAGFTSPTPVTTVTAADIAATGATDINDVLQDLPQFRPTYTSTANDARQYAAGANYAEIRGLNPTRTLVLVNGERVVPEVPTFNTSITYQVDLDVIPTIAIQRVDVVTGGASSVWGSDAVAGVVNLLLYKRYDGLLVNGSAGISQYGDNRSEDVGVLAGTSFVDNRAHIVVAADYDQNDGVGNIFTRPWGKAAPYLLPNAACSGCYIAGTGFQNATYAPGGLITNTALKGIAFGPGGAPYQFPTGTFVSGSAGEFGGTVPGNYPQAGVDIEPPMTRASLYSYLSYDITDNLTVDLTINSADSHSTDPTKPLMNSYTILSGNPYIPSSIQSYMTAHGIPSFSLGVWNSDLGNGYINQAFDDWTNRASLGLQWNIGHSWTADMYYAYGENLQHQVDQNNLNLVRAAQAANAVLGPNGQIACANPANGCVPLDVLGPGAESPGALGFIEVNAWSKVRYVQEVGAFNLHGEPFSIWAGPVSLAAGVETRNERQTDLNDPYQQAGQLLTIDNSNFSGSFNVKEGYLETVIPLAKGLPFIKELDFNAADRETDYSTVGHVDTWKYGATWNVTDDLLFRATHSRDIRAPNLSELFYPSTLQNSTTVVPGQTPFAQFYSGGNANLKPEVALGTVGGLTYRPHFVPGLNLSVDYFYMHIADVITSAAPTTLLTACAAGSASACAQINKVNGIVTTIIGGFTNISTLDLRGVDSELDYSFPLARLSLPGTLIFRALGTYTDELAYQVEPGVPFVNYAGQTAAGIDVRSPFYAPRFKGEFSASYDLNAFAVTLLGNFISRSQVDKTMTTVQYPENNLPSYTEFNLLGSYSFGTNGQFQLYSTVNNLFNKAPIFAPNPLLIIPTNPAMYDAIGRTYKLGFRYKL